jgi:threonine dehydrogenase-like Zn-dependent dehydrogenase
VREQAVKCLGPGGKLVLVGLTPEPLTITNSIPFSFVRQQILGHYGSAPEAVRTLVDLARHHRLDWARSISGHVPLAEAPAAVERLARKEGSPIRLILVP